MSEKNAFVPGKVPFRAFFRIDAAEIYDILDFRGRIPLLPQA